MSEGYLRPLLLFRVFGCSAMTCELDVDLCHIDIKKAFVPCDLKETMYTRLPHGCGGLSREESRLNNSVYGLKQAST